MARRLAPLALLLLLSPDPAAGQSCSPTTAQGTWSGSEPGVPSVGCNSCSGSNSAGFSLACEPGYTVSGASTGTCTYSKACSANKVLGVCYSCSSCGYTASFSSTGSCTQCAPGSFKATTDAGACTLCPAGSFQNASGATSCLQCP